MSMGPNSVVPGAFDELGKTKRPAPPSAEAIEARRLERTRPRMRQFATEKERDIWLASLPRGDRVIAQIVCVPTGKKAAKGRRPYHALRVVDRKIWMKLDQAARGRYIDAIRAELGA